MSLGLACALFASGCFSPDIPSGAFTCDEAQNKGCPSGYSCIAGRCHKSGTVVPDLAAEAAVPDKPGVDTQRDAGTEAMVPDVAMDMPRDFSQPEDGARDVGGPLKDTHPLDSPRPDVLSPDTLSPDTLSPDTLSPDTLSPDTLSPDTLSPDTLSPDTLSPDILSPDILSPDPDQGIMPVDVGVPPLYCPSNMVHLPIVVPQSPARFDVSVDSKGVVHVIAADLNDKLMHVTLQPGAILSETLTPGASKAAIAIDKADGLHVAFAHRGASDYLHYVGRDPSQSGWSSPIKATAGYGIIADKMVDIDARGSHVVGIGSTVRDSPSFPWNAWAVFGATGTTATPLCTAGTASFWFETVRVAAGTSHYAFTEARASTTSPSRGAYVWRKATGSCAGTYKQVPISAAVPLAVQLDPKDDSVHLAYGDGVDGPLVYTTWDGTDAGSLKSSSPVNRGVTPSSVDIAVDEDSHPHIVYRVATTTSTGAVTQRLRLLSIIANGGTTNANLEDGVGAYTRLHHDPIRKTLHVVYTTAFGAMRYRCRQLP